MSQVVLASAEVGMAFEFEGHHYVKTEEVSQQCHRCEPLEGETVCAKWLSQSRKVTIL